MLRFNPVMAAKYQALTRAADAAVPAAGAHDGARTRPAAADGTCQYPARNQPEAA